MRDKPMLCVLQQILCLGLYFENIFRCPYLGWESHESLW